jgi:hypothetical protein
MNFADYLINDFKGDTKIKSIKFFRSSGAYGYIAWLTIISFYLKKTPLTIEHLVDAVEFYASRRTVLDFLNRGYDSGFIDKKNSFEDKRKIFLEPSKITLVEFNEWAMEFTSNIRPL